MKADAVDWAFLSEKKRRAKMPVVRRMLCQRSSDDCGPAYEAIKDYESPRDA